MKKIVALILVLLWPSVSLAAIAHVQTPANGTSAVGTTVAQPAFASNVTAGNLITWACMVGGTGNTITGSDTLGNTYVTDINITDTVDAGQLGVGHSYNIAGGADTWSCTISGGATTLRVSASEFSGAATAAALDKVASTTSNGTNIASGAVTPTTDGQLFYVAERTSANATCTAGTDFTRIAQVPSNSPSTRMCVEYYVQPTAASHDGTWTVGAGLTWAVTLQTFKAVATAVTIPIPRLNVGKGGLNVGSGKFVIQ